MLDNYQKVNMQNKDLKYPMKNGKGNPKQNKQVGGSHIAADNML